MSTSTDNRRLSVEEVKQAAAGREVEILELVAGIPRELLDGKHHACPKCMDGTDRFRLLDRSTGAVRCNQCFPKKCGDFLAAIQHFRSVDLPTALRLVSEYMRLTPASRPASKRSIKPKRPTRTFPSCDALVKYREDWFGPLTHRHDYHSAAGEKVGCVLRWDYPDAVYGDRMEFLGWQWLSREADKAGKPLPRKLIKQASLRDGVWVEQAMPSPRPLYRLPEVLAAKQVLVVEGEKAADEFWTLSAMAVLYPPFAVTTSPGGAQAAQHADWSVLAGRRVTIWPDADDAGKIYADTVVRELRRCNPLPQVRVIRPKQMSLSDGDDLVEFIEMRRMAGQNDHDIYTEILSWLR